MKRAIRSAPWLLATTAIALVVMGIGFGQLGGPAWRIAVALLGLSACLVGWRVHRMPGIFAAAAAVGGLRLVTLPIDPSRDRVAELTTMGSIGDVSVGFVLAIILCLAVRFRRGGLDTRDGLDVMTVSIGAALMSWIVIASPLIFVLDVEPAVAIAAASYLPLAVLMLTLVLDLLFTGLQSNRTMQLLTVAAVANLVGAAIAAFALVQLGDAGLVAEVATFGAAYLFLCAALAHEDGPGILVRDDSRERASSAYTPLRLALTGACLIVPGVLVAPFNQVDVLIRVIALLALVCAVVGRLFTAIRNHEAAHDALVSRLQLDDLTRLPTRARFITRVDELLEQTWRSEFQPTIIQLNLDRFKNINDSLGHYDANRVLVVVAERLAAAATAFGGDVARSGGDDFVVIDATTTSPEESMSRVETVRAALAAPVEVGDAAVFVTASVGVAVAPRHRTLTAEELMRRADIATHRAKAAGRNSVAVFDDSMQSHLAHRMDVEHALHGAIGRQEMRLYYQPIVDITTGVVSGFESLIRWQRDGKIVAPIEFIPIAEDTGLICELGAWALNEALLELRGWVKDGVVAPDATISVNVSPRQIADPGFADVVRSALDQSGIDSSLLWLEMTESMMLEEPELAESTLRQIREMGVRLALDDFGTGYSSLSLLQQFPIQRIKIDRAFVNGIAEQGNDRSLVRTIIAMANSMGLDLVAEGVETIQQLQALRELNCDKAQGFLISHPVPADAMRSTMVALNELRSLSLFGAESTLFSDAGLGTDCGRTTELDRMTPTSSETRSSSSFVGARAMSRPLGQPVL
jgi:diguanylate cyclase (GGDEF)-like protein